MGTGSEFNAPWRQGSGSVRRVAWAPVVLTIGVALLFAGCAGSATTPAPTATTAPTQAVTATTTAPNQAVTAAATEAAPTVVSTTTTAPATAAPVPAGGSIVFAPSTFSCSDSETIVTITWKLGAGTSGDQQILYEWDGSLGQGGQMPKAVSTAGFARQSNGSWRQTETTTGFDLCSNLGLKAGSHVWSVVMAQGDGTPGPILAKGPFTVTK